MAGRSCIEVTTATGNPTRKLDTRRPYVPPEPCPEHPGSTVVRRGSYKSGLGKRQRYLCTPKDWDPRAERSDPDPELAARARHVFTPVLPRAHMQGDAACPHCSALRAIHRGETAVARGHTTAACGDGR